MSHDYCDGDCAFGFDRSWDYALDTPTRRHRRGRRRRCHDSYTPMA